MRVKKCTGCKQLFHAESKHNCENSRRRKNQSLCSCGLALPDRPSKQEAHFELQHYQCPGCFDIFSKRKLNLHKDCGHPPKPIKGFKIGANTQHAPTLGYSPTVDRVPELDKTRDDKVRLRVIQELQEKPNLATGDSHGDVTGRLVLRLLQLCRPPDSSEALVLPGQEAARKLAAGPTGCPIFTKGQQMFNWDTDKRPIEQIFGRIENLDRTVSVQVPSRRSTTRSYEQHTLSEIEQRFRKNTPTDDPWNNLDLNNPLPPITLPMFLSGVNCQLLASVKDTVLGGKSGERTVIGKEDWNEWRNVESWVLLSEGGHNTAPHTDSHGLSTWITVQEGQFGFGWLSKPTQEERDAWIANPQGFTGGRWRFTVVTPGETVFFPSGTVHFVFRQRQGQTLALGGHVLQWNGVERWISVVREQMRKSKITNEDVEWSAPNYVRVIAGLIKNRVQNGRATEIGGQELVDRFLHQVKEFEKEFKPNPPAKRAKRKRS